jgi:hypothetical protein
MTKLYFLIASIACILGCNTTKSTHTSLVEQPLVDKIVFLNFSIQKTKQSPIIKLEKATKVNGSLKKVQPLENRFLNFLTFEVFNNDLITQTIDMEHPLMKVVEYVDDDKTFKRKQLELENETFVLRFQNLGETGKVIIYETLKGKVKTKISTIKF